MYLYRGPQAPWVILGPLRGPILVYNRPPQAYYYMRFNEVKPKYRACKTQIYGRIQ